MRISPHKGRVLAALSVLSAVGLVLSGCSNGEDHGKSSPSSPVAAEPLALEVTSGDPAAVRGNYSLGESSMDAQLEGELIIGAGGCLQLLTGQDESTLLVFPDEADPIERGRPGIEISSTRIMVGERASFAGGGYELSEEQHETLRRCVPSGEVFLVQGLAG